MPRLAGWTIGFIGLGLMGRPMSVHLLRAGATLVIHNRSRQVVEDLRQFGMQPAATPREVAERVGVVVLMLPDTAAVDQVAAGPDGLLAGLRPGAVVADMGTTDVAATRRLAARAAEAGAAWVDVPVSGGQRGAESASLTSMAGGAGDAVERLRPMLEVLGRTITHLGGSGAGQVAKAANQMVVGITLEAVAEALTLAERAGVDPQRLREAMMGGSAASKVLEIHAQRMISGDHRPGFRARTERKDLAQALALAAALGLDLPATRLVHDLFGRLVDQGGGEMDHSALVTLLRPG